MTRGCFMAPEPYCSRVRPPTRAIVHRPGVEGVRPAVSAAGPTRARDAPGPRATRRQRPPVSCYSALARSAAPRSGARGSHTMWTGIVRIRSVIRPFSRKPAMNGPSRNSSRIFGAMPPPT